MRDERRRHAKLFRHSVWILSTSLAVACTQPSNPVRSDAKPIPKKGSDASLHWIVDLAVSGGIAGEDYRFTLDDRGVLRYDDRRHRVQRERVLDRDAVARLTRIISSLPRSANQRLRNERCADCFLYLLSLTRNGLTTRIELDSATLPGSEYEPLIAELVTQRETAP